MLGSLAKVEVPEVAIEVAEVVTWAAADYAWDPHRLVAVQGSSAAALHVNTAAGGTQPDSIVPPVLGSTPAPSERSVSPSACCKVEGCQRLLRDEKPYYQRFGVCEGHMRSLAITVDGTLCRFCQQCAKFEAVAAFDGSKRSCRARLIEHNKRRRKMGVNQRTLRKPRRVTPASSKTYREASDRACTRGAAAEQATDTDAAMAGAAGQGEGDDAGAAALDEDGTDEAEHVQQQQQQPAAGAGSASSRAYVLSCLANSASGSLSALGADGNNSKLQQRPGSSRSCAAEAGSGAVSSGDCQQQQQQQHTAACGFTAAACIDMASLLSGQPAAAEAAAGSSVPVKRLVPHRQQQQAGCALAALLNQDQLPELCASPNLSDLMTDIGLDMAADAETAILMDHMLAPLAAPLLPADPAAAAPPVKQEQQQPAAVAAAAAIKRSSAAGAPMVPVDTGDSGRGSSSVLGDAGGSSSCSSSVMLVQHIAAAVASMPGLPLPPGCSLEAVERLSPVELVQWQQVLRLEATIHPAGSQQRKQQEAAAEVVGMLASYKQVGVEQQLEAQQGRPPHAPVLSGLLPKLHELQLQPKLPPKGNSEQLLGYLLGRPPSGGPAAAAAGEGSSGGAAAAGTDGDLSVAALNAAVLKQPRAATSITTTTSMSTGGSDCCAYCGCSTCTCRVRPGQHADGWLAGSTATGSGFIPGACAQTNAAAAGPRPASSTQISYPQGSQLRKRRSEVLVSVPSDDDHAMRLPRLSVGLPPPLSAQGSGSISTLRDDSPEGYQGAAAALHKLRRQGSTDDAAVTSDKASMQRKAGAPVVQQQQQQSASRLRLVERKLQEQQRQLEAMHAMHAQGSKMVLQQQSQQQQPVRQALTAQELEEIEVDLELQQLLLVAQMQVSLSSLDGGSSGAAGAGAAAAAAAGGGSNACYGGMGQLQQQQGWPVLGAAPVHCSMPGGMFNPAAAQQASFAAAGHQQQQQAQLLQQELMMQQMMVQQQQQQQLMARQQQQQMMLQQQMLLQAWCTAGAAGQPSSSAAAAAAAAACMGTSSGAAVLPKGSQAFSLDAAMQVAQGGGMHASYRPVDASMRLSMKVHNATPAQLQPGMHSQLNSMLGAAGAAVESGFMRPGCVHLVLQVRAPLPAPPSVVEAVPRHAPAAAAAAAASSAAADALSSVVAGLHGSDWAQALTGGSEQLSVTVQLPNDQAVLVRDGLVTRTFNLQQQQQQQQPALLLYANAPCSSAAAAAATTNNSSQTLCRLDGLVPGCISSTNLAAHGCVSLLAVGMGLARQGTCVLARMQGMFLPAETRMQPYSRRSFDAQDAVVADCVGVRLQRLQPYGLVHVEFQQGLLLSQAKPLLVVDSTEVAAELQGLLQCVQLPSDGSAADCSSRMSQLEVEHVLIDCGRLLDFRAVFERHRNSRVLEQAVNSTEDVQQPTTAAAASPLTTDAVAVSSRRQQGASSRAAAAAAAAWQRERRRRDIDDSAHEDLPFVASAASPLVPAASGTSATSGSIASAPSNSSITSARSNSSFASARSNSSIASSRSNSSTAAAGEIEPAPESDSSPAAAGAAAAAAAASASGGEVSVGTRQVSSGSAEHSLPPLASAPAPVSRRSGLRSLTTLSLSGGSGFRAAAKPPAAPAAAATAIGGSKPSVSSNGFGSAAAAATRRLKDRLSFAQLVRHRSFSFGRHGATAAAADSLVPPRRDSGSSSCGDSFSIFSASVDNRRSQSLDLGSSRSPFLAALRSRSFRLGGSGPSSRSGGSASPASRRSLDGPPPVPTSSLVNSSNSSGAVAQVLQQRRRQWQEQQQQLARELRGSPEEDGGGNGGREQQQQQQTRPAAAGSSTADGDADTVAGDDDSAFCVAIAAPPQQQQQEQQAPEQEQQQDEVAEEGEEADLQLPLPTQHPLLGPEYIGCMMDVGVRLLCFFVDRGFPASAQMVLDALLTCAAPAASFPTLACAAAGSDGLGLLHRAVRSGRTAMVLAVMGWAVQHRHCFAWDAPGPLGLTPLHLAALLGKQKRPLAAMVLQSSPGLATAWFSVKADNGVTPAMYATTMGLARMNQLAHILLQQQAAERVQAQRQSQRSMRPQQQQQQQQGLDTQLLTDQQQQQQAAMQPACQHESVAGMAAAEQQGDAAAFAKQLKQQQQPAVVAGASSLPAAAAAEQQTGCEPAKGPSVRSVLTTHADCQGAGDRLPREITPAASSSSSSWDHATAATAAAAAAAAGDGLGQECVLCEHASSTSAGSCYCCAAAAVSGIADNAIPAAPDTPDGGQGPEAAKAAAPSTAADDIDEGIAVVDARRPDSFSGSEAAAPCSSHVGSDSRRSSYDGAHPEAGWEHAAPDNKQQQQQLESLRAGSSSSCCSSSSAAAAEAAPSQPANGCCLDAVVGSTSSRSWSTSAEPPPYVLGRNAASAMAVVHRQHEDAGIAPGAAATFTAGCLLSLRSELQCKPWPRLMLLASTVTLQVALALLLLASFLHHAQGLLLFCVLGLLGLTMLQRLLAVLAQPQLHRGLTDAAGLQGQLRLLLHCSLEPLGVPHNCWTLVFEDSRLEDRYCKMLADSRLAVDAALSALIKTSVNLLPLAVRVSSSMLWPGSAAAPVYHHQQQQQQQQQLSAVFSNSWALPLSHQLAGVVAGVLPLAAVLFSPCSYWNVRESVLAVEQSLLLVVMRTPLLFAAAAASAAGGAAAAQAMACHPALFHSCFAAVLLLVFQQRLSWALWQVLWDVGACILLVYADRNCQLAGSGAAVQGLWQLPLWGWAQMLLPLAVLPLLYVCEHVDRSIFLLSFRKGKHSKSL